MKRGTPAKFASTKPGWFRLSEPIPSTEYCTPFQLLAYDAIRPDDERRLGVVECQQTLGVLFAPALDPARDQPTRVGVLERKRIEPIGRCRRIELIALAIGASQHGVDQLAGAESVPTLGELDRLSDRRVSGHAPHVQQLIDAESQQVDHIGIETDQSAADSLRENGIERGTLAQHSVDELAGPATIPRVERHNAALERLVEEFAASQIDADLCCHRSRSSDSTRRCGGGVHEPSIPVVGDEGTATSRRGILPAR